MSGILGLFGYDFVFGVLVRGPSATIDSDSGVWNLVLRISCQSLASGFWLLCCIVSLSQENYFEFDSQGRSPAFGLLLLYGTASGVQGMCLES